MSTPKLIHKVVCIANDHRLAAIISSYFTQLGCYFCVFESPRVKRHDVINEVLGITNTLAKLQPDVVFFAGLTPAATDLLKTRLPKELIVELHSHADLCKLVEYKQNRQTLRCRSSLLAEGLVICAREGKVLEISETSDYLTADSGKRPFLVVCERSNPVVEIIASNYAASIDADFSLVEGPSRDDAEDLQRLLASLYDLEVLAREEACRDVIKRLGKVLSDIHFEKRTAITFITKGVPYGVTITNAPSTHLFSLLLGTTLPRIIMAEKRTPNVRATLLIDPGLFRESETAAIHAILHEKHMHCKVLAHRDAIAINVSNAIDFFPYELLFIASHVGELKGRRWHFNFKARDNSMHVGVMDVAACFALIQGTDQVKVTEFKTFISIDGIPRNSPEWKKIPRPLIEDYVYSNPKDGGIFKTESTEKIRAAAAIQLYDNAFMPMTYVLANFLSPVIFNNGCSSWIYLSERFMFAGARAYIGTLAAVNGLLAKPIAENFMKLCLSGMTISEAIWKSQGEVFHDSLIRPYALVGCHFSTLKVADTDQLDFLTRYLAWTARQWERKADEPDTEDVKRNSREAARISLKYLTDLSSH
jgi:hypothetical protein